MANQNCSACEDLRQSAPNLIVNGLGDTECTSLQNNTGFNPSSGNDDCTDLNNANDCFVGNMEAEVDAYEVCDWKPFMKRFIPNVWTVLKAIICAICGLWANINNLWKKVNCLVAINDAVFTYKSVARQDQITLYEGFSVHTPTSGATMYTGVISTYQYFDISASMVTRLYQDRSYPATNVSTPYGTLGVTGIPVYGFEVDASSLKISGLTSGSHSVTSMGRFVVQGNELPISNGKTFVVVSIRSRIDTDEVGKGADGTMWDSIVYDFDTRLNYGSLKC